MRSFIRLGIGPVAAVALILPSTASASFLVYRCGSNLCRANADGSGQAQLTTDGSSSAPYSSPSLSTDGNHLTFLKGGSLYTSDGNAQNVVGPIAGSGVEAHMAPDGSRVMEVAASGFGPNQILSFNLNGSGQTDDWYPTLSGGYGATGTQEVSNAQTPSGGVIIRSSLCLITNTPPSNSCARVVAQSPNSADVLYLPTLQPGGSTLAVEEGSSTGPTTIAAYNYTTGALIANVTNGTSDASPTWSPDGQWIGFQRGTAIYKVPATGGAPQLLVASGAQPTWGGPIDTTGGGGGGTGTTVGSATVSGLSLGGLTKRQPSVRFNVTRGNNAPNLASVSVGVPSGLSFNRNAFHKMRTCKGTGKKRRCTVTLKVKGLSLSGGKLKSAKLSGGKLVIGLKQPVASLSMTVKLPLLTESKGLQKQVKKGEVKSLKVTIKITDAKGGATTVGVTGKA